MYKFILTAFAIMSLNVFGLERTVKTVCVAGKPCVDKVEYTNVQQKQLKLEDINEKECLVAMKTSDPTYYWVKQVDSNKRHMIVMKENKREKVKDMLILDREHVFDNYWFATEKVSKIPCGSTGVFSEFDKVDQCLKNKNGFKVFCDMKL